MASMAISLQLKPRSSIRNPTLIRFFSSSSSSTTPDVSPNGIPSSSPSQSPSETSFSSFVSDVKSNLNQQSPPQQQKPHTPVDIRQRLAQFRPKTTQFSRPSSDPLSFQGLYQRNSSLRGQETQKREHISLEAIHESLKKLAPSAKDSNLQSKLREGFNMRSRDSNSPVIGGSGNLPSSIFGREMNGEVAESPAKKLQFMKSYEHGDLGTKLIELRPKNLREFSIKELNERLVKVREIEEAEAATKGSDRTMSDLRNSLASIRQKNREEGKIKIDKRIDILGHLGRTPSFMLSPPKEHLVEKYFHPDNMSSAEKLKIELQKVRDEFKMSETDCGSARVQVAQLTTKIKHLTTALHKKDKHSRKGLQEMVQRRKKLLKYLRRTDWDSYCLVLSKLGLRDRPDLKVK